MGEKEENGKEEEEEIESSGNFMLHSVLYTGYLNAIIYGPYISQTI